MQIIIYSSADPIHSSLVDNITDWASSNMVLQGGKNNKWTEMESVEEIFGRLLLTVSDVYLLIGSLHLLGH